MGADYRQQEELEHQQWTEEHEQQFREIFGEENGNNGNLEQAAQTARKRP